MTPPLAAPSSAPVLALNNIVRQHTSRGVVQHEIRVNLAFEKAEVIGLFGANGSGKSTLLDVIAGRIDPTEGEVKVSGHHLRTIRREQRHKLVHHRSQPRLAAPQAGRFEPLMLRPKDLYLSVREALLNVRRTPAPEGRPQVHLFDEPPLELPYGELIFDRFQRLRGENSLVLFSAHPFEPWHLERISETCDRYLFMKDGRLIQLSSFEAFMAHPDVIDYLSALRFS